MPSIRGRVIDKDTGRGIAFLVVAIDGHTTTTDHRGEFIVDVPAGTYELKIRAPFYEPINKIIHVDRDKYIEIKVRRTFL